MLLENHKILNMPELGHSFKVTAEGGPSGTTPLYEQSKCWPKHICE